MTDYHVITVLVLIQIGNLNGLYHFVHSESSSQSTRSLDHKHKALLSEEKVNIILLIVTKSMIYLLQVTFVEQQVAKRRVKRSHLVPRDPWWSKQWYLVSHSNIITVVLCLFSSSFHLAS